MCRYKADKTPENKVAMKAAKAALAAAEAGSPDAPDVPVVPVVPAPGTAAPTISGDEYVPGPKPNPTGCRKVFVGNLPFSVDEATVQRAHDNPHDDR